jgi:hypothetical protein
MPDADSAAAATAAAAAAAVAAAADADATAEQKKISALVESHLLPTKRKCVVEATTLTGVLDTLKSMLNLSEVPNLQFERFDDDFKEYVGESQFPGRRAAAPAKRLAHLTTRLCSPR